MEATKEPGLDLELEGLTKEQLIGFAGEKFGLNVDSSLTKKQIHDAIVSVHDTVLKQAAEQNKAIAKEVATEDDPIVKFRFINMEFKGADLEFVFDSGRGRKKGSKEPRYHFFAGEVYEAPYSVMEMLNNLQVPDNQYVIENGMVKGIKKGFRHRFSCQLLLDKEQLLKIATKPKKE